VEPTWEIEQVHVESDAAGVASGTRSCVDHGVVADDGELRTAAEIQSDTSEKESAEEVPTSAANVQIRFREVVSARFTVPGKYTGRLVDGLVIGAGLGGVVAGPTLTSKWAGDSMPDIVLLLICAMQISVVGLLVGMVIRRPRK
jgi:hypothetical protein